MNSFKDNIVSISGTIDEGLITDETLNQWANMAFGEIRSIVPANNFEPLSTDNTFETGNIPASVLGQHTGEFNKILGVYCAIYDTYQKNPTIYESWEKLIGSNSEKVFSNNVPRFAKAREIPTADFLESNILESGTASNVIDYDYTSQIDYNTGTPLDPVWTRMSGGIKCAPNNWHFKVLWIDTPNFSVLYNLDNELSGFANVPSEVRNTMAIYVSRMVKLYELDNLSAPVFETNVVIDETDWIDAENYGFLSDFSSFSTLMQDMVNDVEGLIHDEDSELATVSIKSKSAQLEVLKNKVGTADVNLQRKIAKLQQDAVVYQQKVSRYQQQYSKMNKDLEQLTLKYNESIASLNGQTFAGKASKTELDKIKQELATLKSQLGRGRR